MWHTSAYVECRQNYRVTRRSPHGQQIPSLVNRFNQFVAGKLCQPQS